MDAYTNYSRGSRVDVVDDGIVIARGTIVRTGSRHVSVTVDDGETYDVPYAMVQSALTRVANKEVIKEEEKDGRKFALVKEEINRDGTLSVVFKVFLNDKPISESEELVTNVYDQENGWSAPDDFDDNKLDLIKSTYESGFDLIVDSYENIEKAISESAAAPTSAPKEPQGKPAFAPGAKPGTGAEEDGASAAESPLQGAEEGEEEAGIGGGEPHAAPAGEAREETAEEATEEAVAEEPAATEAVGASLLPPSFSRSILSNRKTASELLRNPQHRINPVLRREMERRGIDSAEMNDIELADALKDFDFGDSAPKD